MDNSDASPNLPAPFNWCDGRCERCHLTERCTLHRELVGLRSTRDLVELRIDGKVEAAAPSPPAEPKKQDRAARRHGRIRETSLRLLVAIDQCCKEAELEGPSTIAEQARGAAMLLHIKIARIFDDESPVSDPEWLERSAPTLVLIDVLERNLFDAAMDLWMVRGRFDDRWSDEWQKLVRLLRPFMRRVPKTVEQEIARMVREGTAPSPFLQKRRPKPWPEESETDA